LTNINNFPVWIYIIQVSILRHCACRCLRSMNSFFYSQAISWLRRWIVLKSCLAFLNRLTSLIYLFAIKSLRIIF
jgi:hypothetical protein